MSGSKTVRRSLKSLMSLLPPIINDLHGLSITIHLIPLVSDRTRWQNILFHHRRYSQHCKNLNGISAHRSPCDTPPLTFRQVYWMSDYDHWSLHF